MVMGLGLSGCATVRALRASGALVWAWDDQESLRHTAQEQGAFLCPPEDIPWSSLKALILSPGIPHLFPAPHVAAQKARAADVPIVCDVDLLAQAHPQARYIGITGTNGKSTTTALVGHLLKTAGYSCAIGGNIGVPVLSLDPLDEKGIYVLELSSYHLERVPHLILDRAVLLNIAPDHLSRHGGLAGYVAAKKRIFQAFNGTGKEERDFLGVIGVDDGFTQEIYQDLTEGQNGTHLIPFSESRSLEKGFYKQGVHLYQSWWDEKQMRGKEQGGTFCDHGPVFDTLVMQPQNVLAAYAVGVSLGIPDALLKKGLSSFQGLPHRLEILGFCEGVLFVNDSKATNTHAAAHALSCFENIYWILGGQAKEEGLGNLESYYPKVRHAFLVGEASLFFSRILEAHNVPFTHAGTIERATQQAFLQAQKEASNDPVVLLSPACASWDQFKNFEERGNVFRRGFETLQHSKGLLG